jgi:hypothetical protein
MHRRRCRGPGRGGGRSVGFRDNPGRSGCYYRQANCPRCNRSKSLRPGTSSGIASPLGRWDNSKRRPPRIRTAPGTVGAGSAAPPCRSPRTPLQRTRRQQRPRRTVSRYVSSRPLAADDSARHRAQSRSAQRVGPLKDRGNRKRSVHAYRALGSFASRESAALTKRGLGLRLLQTPTRRAPS